MHFLKIAATLQRTRHNDSHSAVTVHYVLTTSSQSPANCIWTSRATWWSLLHKNNNNSNINYNYYKKLLLLYCCHYGKAIARVHPSFDECRQSVALSRTLRPSQPTCTVIALVSCHHPHQPLPFIIIIIIIIIITISTARRSECM